MRTLREVLLEKHQAAEPKLDAIRERVNAGLGAGARDARARSKEMARGWQPVSAAIESSWRQFFWSLRYHLAGLGAAWLVALTLGIDRTPDPTPGVTRRSEASPQQLLAALLESQRKLRELVAAPDSAPAQEPPRRPPSPQSQGQPSSTTAV